jgi:serine/threonine protein kinase
MIFSDRQALKNRIAELTGRRNPERLQVYEDTTAFMAIDFGSVLRLGGNDYLVMGHAREGRFGIDEQPKFWVKSCIDLTSGRRKIVKLVFHESFDSQIGTRIYHCVRSAAKEAEILRATQHDPNFMHGGAVHDRAGNLVRIIDYVDGLSFYEYLRRLEMTQNAYYHQVFPGIIQSVIGCIESIARLHANGLNHGDIRADHILLSSSTGPFTWIDFDYEVDDSDYDVFCLGNVLLQAVGKGRHSLHDVRLNPTMYPDYQGTLTYEDMSLMFRHRVANLRKLFPLVARDLNDILMRFSVASTSPYRTVEDLLTDLRALYPAEGDSGDDVA